MSKAEILVRGATGRTGGVAIDTLLKMDKRVRAYMRKDGEEAASLRKKGVEIAIGDFTDIDAIHAAMQGVRSAYFLHPISPGIVQASAFFAQAAKEAGVATIVNMSQISARRNSDAGASSARQTSRRRAQIPSGRAQRCFYPH